MELLQNVILVAENVPLWFLFTCIAIAFGSLW